MNVQEALAWTANTSAKAIKIFPQATKSALDTLAAEVTQLTEEVLTLKRVYNQLFDATQQEQARAEAAEKERDELRAKEQAELAMLFAQKGDTFQCGNDSQHVMEDVFWNACLYCVVDDLRARLKAAEELLAAALPHIECCSQSDSNLITAVGEHLAKYEGRK